MALAVMVSSCSFKTLYNQLDYLIPVYVEGMVTLDSVLEEKVDQRSLILLNWHRNTQLKLYATFFRVLQRDINKPLTIKKIRQHIETLDDFWQLVKIELNKEMAKLLPLLNAAQRKELFSNIKEKNDEFREEYVDIEKEKQVAQYIERMIDNYENWLGELTENQVKAVKHAAVEMHFTAKLRLELRRQWQQTIKQILERNDSLVQKSEKLRYYFIEYNNKNNTAMKILEDKNKTIFAALTVKLIHSMTSEQKAYFKSKTNDYIRMFDELAKER